MPLGITIPILTATFICGHRSATCPDEKYLIEPSHNDTQERRYSIVCKDCDRECCLLSDPRPYIILFVVALSVETYLDHKMQAEVQEIEYEFQERRQGLDAWIAKLEKRTSTRDDGWSVEEIEWAVKRRESLEPERVRRVEELWGAFRLRWRV